MLKPIMPKFRPNQSVRLKDIAEKQVPAKLKPIVVFSLNLKMEMGRPPPQLARVNESVP